MSAVPRVLRLRKWDILGSDDNVHLSLDDHVINVQQDGQVPLDVQAGHSIARQRWIWAITEVMKAKRTRRASMTLREHGADPVEQFAAAIVMTQAMVHADELGRRILLRALQRKQLDSFDTLTERVQAEFIITSSKVFDFFTPRSYGKHRAWVVATVAVFCCIIFAFMAAGVPAFEENSQCSRQASPHGAWLWFFGTSKDWCVGLQEPSWKFNSAYMISWGSRYGPKMKQAWRLCSSLFIHGGAWHLLSNAVLFLIVGHDLERRYGVLRVIALFLVSGVLGNVYGLMLDAKCSAVGGLSGAIFGFCMLEAVDTALNWRQTKRPIFRSIVIVGLVAFVIVGVATTPAGFATWTHVFGCLGALPMSLIYQKSLVLESVHIYLPVLGLLGVVILFVVGFSYFYAVTLPSLAYANASVACAMV